jgi:hypothetical protein
MNVRKEYFEEWKKESQLISLNAHFSRKFHRSLAFQKHVLLYVKNPRKQLELTFCFSPFEETRVVNLKRINDVKKIRIKDGEVIPYPVNVDEIEYSYCYWEDPCLAVYSKVRKLSIHDDDGEEVCDLQTLSHLETGVFWFRQCANYHCLANLKSLDLRYCDSVTDVSCFQNIPKLRLISCMNILDVSSLGMANELNLSRNYQITDVSALGEVHTLCLSECWGISDVSALSNVRNLDISCCGQISDVSGLKAVIILDITYCQKIRDISMISTLQELNMRCCGNIHDLSDLVQLKRLEFDGMTVIHRPNYLILRKLSLCQQLVHITDHDLKRIKMPKGINLDDMTELRFNCCFFQIELPRLRNLQSLTIVKCNRFTSLPYLPSLGFLELSDCDHLGPCFILLGDSTGEEKYPIYEVKIRNCSGVNTISFHRKIFQCQIINCSDLHELKVFAQIDLLKIDECMHETGRILLNALVVSIKMLFSNQKYQTEFGNNQNCEIIMESGILEVMRMPERHERRETERNCCRLV